MSIWTVYDLQNGLMPGMTLTGAHAADLAQNTPAGCALVGGRYDHLSQRVDLKTGQVVDYQPPAPPDDALRTWSWDATTRRWAAAPTLPALKAQAQAPVMAEIQRQEAAQTRSLRELMVSAVNRTPAPAAASAKCLGIDVNCTALRAVLDAMAAAPDAATLAAITWTAPALPDVSHL